MTRPIHLVLFVKLWLINDKNLYLSIWRNWRIIFWAEISQITWNKYARIWEKITVLFKFSFRYNILKWGGCWIFFGTKKCWFEQKDDFFEINIFSVWHLFFFPLSAIEELFWNLTGVRRSCRPPPPPLYPPLSASP